MLQLLRVVRRLAIDADDPGGDTSVMAHHVERDPGFFLWSLIGLMLSFGTVAIGLFGWPLLLLGLVLLGVMLGRGPRWPAALGTLTGVGITSAIIGAIGHRAAPGLWAASGAGLVVVSVTAFWWLRCRLPY